MSQALLSHKENNPIIEVEDALNDTKDIKNCVPEKVQAGSLNRKGTNKRKRIGDRTIMANLQPDTACTGLASVNTPSTSKFVSKSKTDMDYKKESDKAGKVLIRGELKVQVEPSTKINADLCEVDQNGVDVIYHQLIHMWTLNGQKPVSFWSLVLDYESFEKTVLNIFHASFLINDGYVVYYKAKNKTHPLVYPIPKAVFESSTRTEETFILLEITYEEWENLKATIPLKNE